MIAKTETHQSPTRIEIATHFDPLEWLATRPAGRRRFWQDRDGSVTLAGDGLAWSTTDPKQAQDWIRSLSPRTHLLVSGQFEGGMTWSLPQVEVGRDSDGGWMAFYRPYPAALDLVAPHQGPDQSEWIERVECALAFMRTSPLKKVVLARHQPRMTQRDPLSALRFLMDQDPQTYGFLIETGAIAFFGASPERLYRRDARTLQTEALAGTQGRSADPQTDAALANTLFASLKDQHEHALVVDELSRLLQGLCYSVQRASAPQIRRYSHVQHLCTPIAGQLHPGITDADLLATLHPTPAVAGTPTEAARTLIHTFEGRRGPYAAPIGRQSAASSEFAVGLRCATLCHGVATVHAGAGIVPGSDPHAEWQELDRKSAGMWAALQ